jgi:hypothetical protein
MFVGNVRVFFPGLNLQPKCGLLMHLFGRPAEAITDAIQAAAHLLCRFKALCHFQRIFGAMNARRGQNHSIRARARDLSGVAITALVSKA